MAMVLDQFSKLFLLLTMAQHDELETNLKKILHTNGVWGLEAIVM